MPTNSAWALVGSCTGERKRGHFQVWDRMQQCVGPNWQRWWSWTEVRGRVRWLSERICHPPLSPRILRNILGRTWPEKCVMSKLGLLRPDCEGQGSSGGWKIAGQVSRRYVPSPGLPPQDSAEWSQAKDAICLLGSPEQSVVLSASVELVAIDRAEILFLMEQGWISLLIRPWSKTQRASVWAIRGIFLWLEGSPSWGVWLQPPAGVVWKLHGEKAMNCHPTQWLQSPV